MKLGIVNISKNEDDFIEEYLAEASRWADGIYMYDNESTDNTKELASNCNKVRFLETIEGEFLLNMHERLFREALNDLGPDSWVMMLDTDMVIDNEPRVLIESALNKGKNSVVYHHPVFFFTYQNYLNYESEDKSLPMIERRLWYRSVANPCALLYRNEEGLGFSRPHIEPPDKPTRYASTEKKDVGLVRHYRFRTPEQIKERLSVRHKVREGKGPEAKRKFGHYNRASWEWKDYIIDESFLFKYDPNDSEFKWNFGKRRVQKPNNFKEKKIMMGELVKRNREFLKGKDISWDSLTFTHT